MLLELTGGGLSSYNLLLAPSPCNTITLLFPAPGGRAQRGRTSAAGELSPGVGVVGVQRGGLGGPAEETGAWALRGRLHRPGRGLPRRAAGRSARAPQPPPARAPLSRAPGPASAAAGCWLPAGRLHASGARTSPAGSRAPGSALHRRAEPGGAAVCTSGASGRRRAASARAA